MNEQALIESINQNLDIAIPINSDQKELHRFLSGHINQLIQNDFGKLVSLLYRIDVNEIKLKQLLKENPGTDAGLVIADLIIERQLQKIKSRRQLRQRDNNIDEKEKW